MGLDYLDLMIIHSPQPWDKVNQSDDRYVQGNRAAWRALEDEMCIRDSTEPILCILNM